MGISQWATISYHGTRILNTITTKFSFSFIPTIHFPNIYFKTFKINFVNLL